VCHGLQEEKANSNGNSRIVNTVFTLLSGF